MSFDNTLFAITLIGIVLSLAYFRAAYLQWRFERALEGRRLNTAEGLPRGVQPAAARSRCTVLEFKGACARKARDAHGADVGTDAAMGDTRQRGGGTA